nr:hypothetical protein [Tanacetum cinerariifolium]
MESIKQCIVERARHEQEIHNMLKRLNERMFQIQECMVQKFKASDASLGEKDYSRIVSDKRNDQADDTDIRPSYDKEPTIEVPYIAEYNVFTVNTQHYEQPKSIINTCVVEKVDSNVIPDSLNMCDNEIQTDQNAVECDDERSVLANLIANLKLNINENKKIQKQLKKENASLTQELKECKSTLAKTSRTLGDSNSIRDTCLITLQNKQTGLEKYMAFNDCTVDYEKLKRTCDMLETDGRCKVVTGAPKRVSYTGERTKGTKITDTGTLKMTDDEETDDQFVHVNEEVNDDEDEEMLNAEVEDFGKGDVEISDVTKSNAKNIEEIKDDAKKAKLPLTSFVISVSSGSGTTMVMVRASVVIGGVGIGAFVL